MRYKFFPRAHTHTYIYIHTYKAYQKSRVFLSPPPSSSLLLPLRHPTLRATPTHDTPPETHPKKSITPIHIDRALRASSPNRRAPRIVVVETIDPIGRIPPPGTTTDGRCATTNDDGRARTRRAHTRSSSDPIDRSIDRSHDRSIAPRQHAPRQHAPPTRRRLVSIRLWRTRTRGPTTSHDS